MTTPPTPTDPAQRLADLEREIGELEAILARVTQEQAHFYGWVVVGQLAAFDYAKWRALRRPERGG